MNSLKSCIEDIGKELDGNKFTDTGKAKKSLHEFVEEKGTSLHGQVIGAKHIEYTERGTGPWKGDVMENTKKLYGILSYSGWFERRNIDEEARFPIAYTIVSSGSQVHRGKRKGINLDKIVQNLAEKLTNELRSSMVDVSKYLKK